MKKGKHYIVAAVGVILLIFGLCFTKAVDNVGHFLMALPYVCIGVGCGMLGHGLSNLVAERMMQKHPELRKQKEINEKDERNILVASRAKAKAYDFMTYVFGALMVAFALMEVDVMPVLLLVCAYLLVHGYAIYYRFRYEKEM